jgi:adenylate cyclase class IV
MQTIEDKLNINSNTNLVCINSNTKQETNTKLELDIRASQQPIYLPDNAFIAKFKDLGIDELLAAFIDPASSAVGNLLLPQELKQYVLPVTGPAAEKAIFILRHAFEAKGIYKTTPKKIRKPYKFYLKEGVKHGAENLVKDLVYHDPIYIGLMYAGLTLFPEIHPSVISFADYLISVPMAVGIDVMIDELRHKKTTKNIVKSGFHKEKYYESRFRVLKEKDPKEALEDFMQEFNLQSCGTVTYKDTYFDINSKGFSGREVSMRLRQREKRDFEKENKEWIQEGEFSNNNNITSLQITYTRAREHKGNKNTPDQCRYFPVKKEKLYAILDPNAKTLEDITDNKILHLAKSKIIDNKTKEITFERTIARNGELAICTDKVVANRPYYILELKVYKNTNLLKQAMRYIMVNFPLAVEQTTYGKNGMLI